MKQLSLLALSTMLAMNATAATNYVVWSGDDLNAEEEQIPVAWYQWWACTTEIVDDASSPEGKALTWHSENNTDAFSFGLYQDGSSFDNSTLIGKDLVFYVKSDCNATFHVRLTGEGDPEDTYKLDFPRDGKWYQLRLNVPKYFPDMETKWTTSKKGYVFSVIAENAEQGATLYTADIHYEDAVAIPEITATAQNVTLNSAEIAYDVTLPEALEGATVTVNYNEATTQSSPIMLTDLSEKTRYTYTITATATLNGKSYTSNPVSVAFRTQSEDATDWHCISDGELLGAYKEGEDPDMARRNIPVSAIGTVSYNTDKTITLSFDIKGIDNVVGFMREVNIGGEWSGDIVAPGENGQYSYTSTKTFEANETINDLFYWLKYNGGVVRINISGYKAGMENSTVSYGEPIAIKTYAASTILSNGKPTPFYAVAIDADNHYLLDEKITLTASDGLTVSGDFLTANKYGKTTLTASVGKISTIMTFECVTSATSTNIVKGILPTVSEYANNPANATDDNEGTEVAWTCGETEEHSLDIDFGQLYYVEMIELVWEGASATEYTVSLFNNLVDDSNIMRAEDNAAAVFTVTDGVGGAGMTIHKHLYQSNYQPISARNLTLATTKAFDSTWGIKLKEIRVFGTPNNTVGIENIVASEETTVNVYTITGVKVLENVTRQEAISTLSPGLYIIGNEKLIVR